MSCFRFRCWPVPVCWCAVACWNHPASVNSYVLEIPKAGSECESIGRTPVAEHLPMVGVPLGTRIELEKALARGAAAIRWDGCHEIHVVEDCVIPANRAPFEPVLREGRRTISDREELVEAFPVGGLLDHLALPLQFVYRTSGVAVLRPRAPGELDASCASATHFVAGVTYGAFALLEPTESTTADRTGEAFARWKARRQLLAVDGTPEQCRAATRGDHPPNGCSAIIAVSLTPLQARRRQVCMMDESTRTKRCAPEHGGIKRDARGTTLCGFGRCVYVKAADRVMCAPSSLEEIQVISGRARCRKKGEKTPAHCDVGRWERCVSEQALRPGLHRKDGASVAHVAVQGRVVAGAGGRHTVKDSGRWAFSGGPTGARLGP